jgi:hypothetical protein
MEAYMRSTLIILLALSFAPSAMAQNYEVDWWTLASGGGHSQSSQYQVDGTAGQTVVGRSSSSNFIVETGFWSWAISGPRCEYLPGDANGNSEYNGIDVTFSVSYLKGFGNPPPNACECDPNGMLFAAADANGNCQFNGIDVTYSVTYLKGVGQPPQGCPDCLPARFRAGPEIPQAGQESISNAIDKTKTAK